MIKIYVNKELVCNLRENRFGNQIVMKINNCLKFKGMIYKKGITKYYFSTK